MKLQQIRRMLEKEDPELMKKLKQESKDRYWAIAREILSEEEYQRYYQYCRSEIHIFPVPESVLSTEQQSALIIAEMEDLANHLSQFFDTSNKYRSEKEKIC